MEDSKLEDNLLDDPASAGLDAIGTPRAREFSIRRKAYSATDSAEGSVSLAAASKAVVEEFYKRVYQVKSGWLFKEGAKRKSIKRRFLILRSDKSFAYYEKDDLVNLKGEVHATDFTKTEPFSVIKQLGQHWGLKVKTKRRTWKFFFVSEEERDSWRNAFVQVQYNKGAVTFQEMKGIHMNIDFVSNVPRLDCFGQKSDPYVKIQVTYPPNDEHKEEITRMWRTRTQKNREHPVWNESINIGDFHDETYMRKCKVELSVWDWDQTSPDELVGSVTTTIHNLTQYYRLAFPLQKYDAVVWNSKRKCPCYLNINIADNRTRKPEIAPSFNHVKTILLLTRGTRGDVQPFIALSRGLIETYKYRIVMATESAYFDRVREKCCDLIAKYPGCLTMITTGGDTMKRTDSKIAKWAMANKSEVLQMLMLSRAESEFFDSADVLYWHCNRLKRHKMQPDLIIFGFTMGAMAAFLSEKFEIPLMGFILQPSCIPSEELQAVVPIASHSISLVDRMEENIVGQNSLKRLKSIWETNPIWGQLNKIRKRYNMSSLSKGTWHYFQKYDVPMIVPMAQYAFGERPKDWTENTVFTDFIFLRTPMDKAQSMTPELTSFLQSGEADAHRGTPTILIAFSSMPVSKRLIFEIIVKIATRSKSKPRIIGVTGPRDEEKLPESLTRERDELIASRKIFICGRAPFGLLFDLMDAVIIHGGLGTTAEALRAALPTIVTGVLLMDQRFWGQRCKDLNVGPGPTHVSNFLEVCCDFIDEALEPDSEWKKQAEEVANRIKAQSLDGVPENMKAINELFPSAPVFRIMD